MDYGGDGWMDGWMCGGRRGKRYVEKWKEERRAAPNPTPPPEANNSTPAGERPACGTRLRRARTGAVAVASTTRARVRARSGERGGGSVGEAMVANGEGEGRCGGAVPVGGADLSASARTRSAMEGTRAWGRRWHEVRREVPAHRATRRSRCAYAA
ncbi:hypothetical protein C8J57DRAFT_1474547 [Mycena rebaudengoi]|nr:hypothetical protein C8J57DRAFT_1474547 [Mycena rebaudengoi]